MRAPMAMPLDAGDQCLVGDTVNRRFTCLVNGRHKHFIGSIKTAGKVVKQVAQTRVAVRLANSDQLALAKHRPRRFQHGGNLDRVVAIIVNDPNHTLTAPVRRPFPHIGEPAFHTAKTGQ